MKRRRKKALEDEKLTEIKRKLSKNKMRRCFESLKEWYESRVLNELLERRAYNHRNRIICRRAFESWKEFLDYRKMRKVSSD